MTMTPRTKRAMILAGVAFGGLLLVALLSPGGNAGSIKPPVVSGLSPGELPPVRTIGGPVQGSNTSLLGSSREGRWQVADPKTGQLEKEIFYDVLDPQPDGRFHLAKPRAHLYLSPWRVIHLSSEEATLVAPDNRPQSGQFKGNVLVHVYHAAPPGPVNTSEGSKDLLFIMKMDQADFDATLGEIRSSSEVEVITPRADEMVFRGRGLRMIYNEINQRIEYLEITEGDSLKYRPVRTVAAADPAPKPPTPRVPADPSVPIAAVAPEAPAVPTVAEPPKSPSEEITYYQVTFEDDVKVRADQRTIDAEKMVVWMTLEDSPGSKGPPKASSVPKKEPTGPEQLDQPPSVKPPSKALDAQTASLEELLLTWKGRMVMVPVAERPAALAGPEDYLMRFEGAPLQVGLEPGADLVGHTLEYLNSTGEMTTKGTAAYPLRITSNTLGIVHAPSLVMRADGAGGSIGGPGWIRSTQEGDAPKAPPVPGAPPESRGLPPGMRIAWQEGVDLSFGPNRAIQSALFKGDVQVDESRFDLSARHLKVLFAQAPEGDRQKARLEGIEAVGGVHASLEAGEIYAEQLNLTMTEDASGNLIPSLLVAQQDVLAVDPGKTLSAGRLDVTLAPKKPMANQTNPAKPAADSDSVQVEPVKIVAMDDLHISLADGVRVQGDRLDGDVASGVADVTGSPVIITRAADAPGQKPKEGQAPAGASEIRVPHLRILEQGKQAIAKGPGSFFYQEADQPAAPEKPAKPGTKMNVTWEDRMHYEEKGDLLEVFGSVKAKAEDSPTSVNNLTADHMLLHFVKNVAPTVPAAAPAPVAAVGAFGAASGQRRLETFEARGNVDMRGFEYADAQRKKVLTRVYITGPSLVFREADRVAQVVGPGTMLLEDYRPQTVPTVGKSPTAPKGLSLSGRGATGFKWDQRLVIDQLNTDMIMIGNVDMRHMPMDGTDQDTIELQTDRLVADLASSRAIRLTGPENMTIRRIVAAGAVRMQERNRLVEADKMEYDDSLQTVLLSALLRNKVRIIRLDRPKPITAKTLLWKLKTDTVEVIDAGL